MDPLIGAALISGGSNLLGGLIGGGSSAGGGIDGARNWQKWMDDTKVQRLVRDAKKANINPLAALGVGSYTGSPSYVGTDRSGFDFAQLGQDISSSIMRRADRKGQLEMQALLLEKARAQLRGDQLQNDILAKRLQMLDDPTQAKPVMASPGVSEFERKLGVVGQADVAKTPGVKIVESEIPASSSLGVIAGVKPLENVVVNKSGGFGFQPTEEQAEIYESSLIDNAKYGVSRAWNYLSKLWHGGYIVGPGAMAARNKLRDNERSKLPRAPVGKEWRLQLPSGDWVLREKKGLFYDDYGMKGREILKKIPYAYETIPRGYRK